MPRFGEGTISHAGPFMSPMTPGLNDCLTTGQSEDLMMEMAPPHQTMGFAVQSQGEYLSSVYSGPQMPLALPGSDVRDSTVSNMFCESSPIVADPPSSSADFANLFAETCPTSWMPQGHFVDDSSSRAAQTQADVLQEPLPDVIALPQDVSSSGPTADVGSEVLNVAMSSNLRHSSSDNSHAEQSGSLAASLKEVGRSSSVSTPLTPGNDFADSPSPSFCLEDLDARLCASRRESDGDGTEEVLRRIDRLREASKLAGVNSYANGPALSEASKSSRTPEENRRCGKRKSAYISRFAAKKYQKLLENEIATAELECAVFKDSLERQRRTKEELEKAVQSLSAEIQHQEV